MQKPEVVFILGGPGSGKGTTCAKIVEKTGYVHLSAGDLLREERAKPNSQFGQLIEEHIKNGTIVPVAITCSLIHQAMKTSSKNRFLVDGFPRNQDNLDGWTKNMSDKTIVRAVIFLECSAEVCTKRCLNRGLQGSGRSDDNMESLVKRHETFIKDTMPMVKHFEELGLLWRFDSERSANDVFDDVYKKLKEIDWVE
ncbi:UMP-CMP kinase isoform X2 [Fopius arisanus]|nr:PREDICTED: UMP-CMP kinase isoform X2 [Fopius arisanus]